MKDNVKTYKKPATDQQWRDHLNGEGPFLGIVPVRQDNTCYFGAIDVDDDAIDHATVASLIQHAELPLLCCRSKSGGAHLYLFTSEPVPAVLMQTSLRKWASALGFSKNHDDRPIEVFPKQAKLKPDDTGNWINLPYYGAKTTNRYCVLADGTTLTLDQFLRLAMESRVSEAQLESIVPAAKGRFSDGPPCLQALDQLGYPEGTRNMGLYNIGIYFKLSDPEHWQDAVHQYNADRLDPPLKKRDVDAVIKSLEQREYIYKCSDLPINPHCKKTACKKQTFGIDAFKTKKKLAQLPELTNLRKIMTDPPRWLVAVNGKDVDVLTEELMNCSQFRRVALERCSLIIPLLKGDTWDDLLQNLLKEHTEIIAPMDAGVMGQFRAIFGEFLLRRYNAMSLDDVLAGLPFQPDGETVVYFRALDLNAFLERRKFRSFDASKLFTVLREMGAGYRPVTIKGAKLQVWSVPVPDDEQQDALDTPKSGKPRF